MEKQASDLAAQLTAFYAAIQSNAKTDDLVIPESIRSVLLAPMCRVARLLLPDSVQKMDEVIYADEMGLAMNEALHGHDLLHPETGAHIELKTSVCKRKQRRHANFLWPIPGKVDAADRREKLVASVKEKCKGGYAIFQIKDGLGRRVKSYQLSEAFLSGYFTHVTLGKSASHNMGCEQCRVCGEFHRLMYFEHASKLMDEAVENGQVLELAWDEILAVRASQCPKPTKKKE
jgi:hypothetical protein